MGTIRIERIAGMPRRLIALGMQLVVYADKARIENGLEITFGHSRSSIEVPGK